MTTAPGRREPSATSLARILAILALTGSVEARADDDGEPADQPPSIEDAQPSEVAPSIANPPPPEALPATDATQPTARPSPMPPAEGSEWLGSLRPSNVKVIAGTLFPLFLIYEFPAPWAGVEVGWRTGTHASVIANAGTSVIWVSGSQRYFFPLGVSVRVFPWERGPWFQFGLGTMPYVERTKLAFPTRSISSTDVGAMTAAKLGVGARIRGWDIGVGFDFNLGSAFENYMGTETLPWAYTFSMWVGVPVWTRRQP